MVNRKRYAPSLQNEEKLKKFIDGKQENNRTNLYRKGCPNNCGCGGCKKDEIQNSIMENGKLWSINFLWTGWAYGMISENLTLTLGIIGGITLIWLNIEGIITHRKNRK